jgi:CubicO group peptidase (beta-lactamase class C family)
MIGRGDVQGHAEPGWGGVVDAFVANFADTDVGDVGAAVCVYRYGVPVVDVWAGAADATTGQPWGEDTVVGVFSVTKGLTAIMANVLMQRGVLDPDAPVADVWPEFAANGKGHIPLRWVLGHRAGLPYIEGEFTLQEALSWTPIVDALAAEAPQWEPGTKHGYHMRSYGWLVGEVIRRASGASSPGAFFRDEVVAPLGLSAWIGMPEAEQHRCARLIPPPASRVSIADVLGPDSLPAKVFTAPSGLFHYDDMWNTTAVRAAEMPSSNGIADARSLARVYAACIGEVDGVRLLDDDTVARACEVQSRGPDEIIMLESCFGLGFMLPPMMPPACGPRSFGHGGAGGSMAFADPDPALSLGYVMNRMRFDPDDRRATSIVDAVYAAAS